MKVLIDTNILARHTQPDHHLHHFAVEALVRLRRDDHELRIVPQVLYEYWVVATRPAKDQGLGLSIDEAFERIEGFKRFFPLLRDERRIYEPWENLVKTHRVQGKTAHDARLVAAMLRHGLAHILTFNPADFQRYRQIQILDPGVVAKT